MGSWYSFLTPSLPSPPSPFYSLYGIVPDFYRTLTSFTFFLSRFPLPLSFASLFPFPIISFTQNFSYCLSLSHARYFLLCHKRQYNLSHYFHSNFNISQCALRLLLRCFVVGVNACFFSSFLTVFTVFPLIFFRLTLLHPLLKLPPFYDYPHCVVRLQASMLVGLASCRLVR